MSLFPALYSPADITPGHGCWFPVGYVPPPVGASANVIMNSLPVHRVGDLTIPHFCTKEDIHPDVIATGYLPVLVNRRPVAIAGVSILAPAGIVQGFQAVTVICGTGALKTPSRVGQLANWPDNPGGPA